MYEHIPALVVYVLQSVNRVSQRGMKYTSTWLVALCCTSIKQIFLAMLVAVMPCEAKRTFPQHLH